MFKARFNIKFYITAVLLLGMVIFGWYGVYFLNTNEILMDDQLPMDPATKTFLTLAFCLILISWTVSFFTVFLQIIRGYAFRMDHHGIHHAATVKAFLAFIWVVPVREIPYTAIEKVLNDQDVFKKDMTAVKIDKSGIDIFPLWKPFAAKEYRFFYGFTREKPEDITRELKKYTPGM